MGKSKKLFEQFRDCFSGSFKLGYLCGMSSTLIRNAGVLAMAADDYPERVSGAQMAHFPTLSNAWVLAENGIITQYGTMDNCPERADLVVDAKGGWVLPAWCDSHTHLVFAATREEEFVFRIKGMGYEEIAEKGGGILNSARKLRAASEDQLFEAAWERLEAVIRMGTGAIEIKSGYGLSVDSELKMLKVIQKIKELSPIPVKSTFLGAHAIPEEYRNNRQGYLDDLVHKMLPVIAGEGLADYIDVFCDRGYFTPDETAYLIQAGARYGLKAKIHANELGLTGGVQTGVANGALSVDHLEHCGPEEISILAGSATIPTLLPSCAFFLGLPYAPARAMLDAGLPVTLATDYNPGSSPSGNMSLVVSLACIKMKMLPEEALQAATINGAAAMELSAQCGSISRGKRANLLLTEPMPSLAYLPYSFGSSSIRQVLINGLPI